MGSTPKKIKLKRCPFCGGKATLEVNHWVGYDLYHPGCEDCDIWVESKVLKTAAKKWNTRITDEVEDTFVEVGGVWIRKVKEEKNDNIPC